MHVCIHIQKKNTAFKHTNKNLNSFIMTSTKQYILIFIQIYDNTLYDHGKVSRKQALEHTDVRLLVKAILLEWKA